MSSSLCIVVVYIPFPSATNVYMVNRFWKNFWRNPYETFIHFAGLSTDFATQLVCARFTIFYGYEWHTFGAHNVWRVVTVQSLVGELVSSSHSRNFCRLLPSRISICRSIRFFIDCLFTNRCHSYEHCHGIAEELKRQSVQVSQISNLSRMCSNKVKHIELRDKQIDIFEAIEQTFEIGLSLMILIARGHISLVTRTSCVFLVWKRVQDGKLCS